MMEKELNPAPPRPFKRNSSHFTAERNAQMKAEGKLGRGGDRKRHYDPQLVEQDLLRTVVKACAMIDKYLEYDENLPGGFGGALKGLSGENAHRLRLKALDIVGRNFLPAVVLIEKFAHQNLPSDGDTPVEATLKVLGKYGGELWLKTKGGNVLPSVEPVQIIEITSQEEEKEHARHKET